MGHYLKGGRRVETACRQGHYLKGGRRVETACRQAYAGLDRHRASLRPNLLFLGD